MMLPADDSAHTLAPHPRAAAAPSWNAISHGNEWLRRAMSDPHRSRLAPFDAFLFDLDDVVTRTATVHAAAWTRLLDEYLAGRATAERTTLVPFDPVEDDLKYVDGKPREAGVESFLSARGISLARGRRDDGPKVETLGGRKE